MNLTNQYYLSMRHKLQLFKHEILRTSAINWFHCYFYNYQNKLYYQISSTNAKDWCRYGLFRPINSSSYIKPKIELL